MFSRASSLSIKTLRAYHEAGILVPAQVDPRTGYRSYNDDQLADAAIVVRLRALDLPLDKVRTVLEGRDPELTRRILADHQIAMQARLDDTERIVAELQSGIAPVTHTPVHVRFEPARHTLHLIGDVEEERFWGWLAEAFRRLSSFLGEAGVTAAGPSGALYDAEIVDDGPTHVEAFIPVADPIFVPARGAGDATGVSIGELPATAAAVLVHAGPYESIGDTYLALGAWVARHAEHAGARIREWYLVGPADSTDEVAYRTEIAWPIKSTTVRTGDQR
jgi:DNA-binding transcriptional MerR regulator